MVFIFTDSIFLLQNTICKYRNIFDSVFLLNTTCIYIYALYFLLYIDCGLFRPFHTSAARSIAVESFFTAKAKALCCYGKFPILSEVKLSERKGHFTHTSSVQSIAVGSFFTAKTKALCCYEKFLFSAKWNYPKEKDILHTLLRRILSPWEAFLRLKQRLRFDDKSIVTRKVKLSKTAKNAILAEFRNRKSYLFPIKNRNDMRNAPWHDLRGVFSFFYCNYQICAE